MFFLSFRRWEREPGVGIDKLFETWVKLLFCKCSEAGGGEGSRVANLAHDIAEAEGGQVFFWVRDTSHNESEGIIGRVGADSVVVGQGFESETGETRGVDGESELGGFSPEGGVSGVAAKGSRKPFEGLVDGRGEVSGGAGCVEAVELEGAVVLVG